MKAFPTMAPTFAPTATSPTPATDDLVGIADDDNVSTDDNASTTAPTTPTTTTADDDGLASGVTVPPSAAPSSFTLAPTATDLGNTTDPNESIIPNDGSASPKSTTSRSRMAWISGAVLGLTALVLGGVWMATTKQRRNAAGAGGMFKLGGTGTGDSAGSSSVSSNSRLVEV